MAANASLVPPPAMVSRCSSASAVTNDFVGAGISGGLGPSGAGAEAGAVAGCENIVEPDGLQRIANLEEACCIAGQAGSALIAGKVDGRGASRPDDEIGLQMDLALIRRERICGLDDDTGRVSPNDPLRNDRLESAGRRFLCDCATGTSTGCCK